MNLMMTFNKTIIPFVIVGYELGYSRFDVCWLFTISYPTRSRGIIIKYAGMGKFPSSSFAFGSNENVNTRRINTLSSDMGNFP